ncbi:transglutaminase family protein [Bacteroidota bacterium]
MKIKLLCVHIILLLLVSCSGTCHLQELINISEENGFTSPRFVEGKMIIKIDSVKIIRGDSLIEFNKRNKIPAEQKPSLFLYSSEIIDHTVQRNVRNYKYNLEPTETFIDEENGNRICYWNLSDSLHDNFQIIIEKRFRFTTYDYRPEIRANIVKEMWHEIPEGIKEFYTKSEPFLEQTLDIVDKAKEITGEETNPILQAKVLFEWIRSSMKYVYPPEKRGAVEALRTCEGDCGQYSNLFIALARSLGIPSRQQSGFNFHPDKLGYHVWSEIYLPEYGWIPVDATDDDGFLHLDNKRLIASVGMNIPLKHSPDWATYQNSEVENGRTGFMQLVTIVMSGIKADISTERIILKSE